MKVKVQFILHLIIVAFLLSSCAGSADKPAEVDLAKAKVEIQAMEDAFAAGEKAKDANAVAAYYSDDAINYSRNEQPTSGKAAITASIAKGIAEDTSNSTYVYKVVDLFAEGELLVEIGSWEKLDSAGSKKDNGHFMSLFRKKDGKYQCIRDMNVSSMPEKVK